jgi:hypothetical protein
VACPDVAQSEATTNANNITNNWEFVAMSEALLNGEDFAATAAEIADAKNTEFLNTLAEEATEGLTVGVECYAFPEWDDITEPYSTDLYEEHQGPAVADEG